MFLGVKPGEADTVNKWENPNSIEHDNDDDFIYA
jgi:hypothetical protein